MRKAFGGCDAFLVLLFRNGRISFSARSAPAIDAVRGPNDENTKVRRAARKAIAEEMAAWWTDSPRRRLGAVRYPKSEQDGAAERPEHWRRHLRLR